MNLLDMDFDDETVRKEIAKACKTIIERKSAPLKSFAHRCHEASLVLVKSGWLTPECRVARGFHPRLNSQHSWVVVGDPYAADAKIIDPTLWSYIDQKPTIHVGRRARLNGSMGDEMSLFFHRPHGDGSIFSFGRPMPVDAKKAVSLSLHAKSAMSKAAKDFLKRLGHLDAQGWMMLASQCPVGDWPAGEIIRAMYETPHLRALVPVDKLGMLTDLNPGGLYLNGPDKTKKLKAVDMKRQPRKRRS